MSSNILNSILVAASDAKKQEADLIAVLQSNAPLKEKADACRELGRIGTKNSIAPLVALLGDKKLSHMARYGLETNPDPAVDEALRDALGALKGLPLVGAIGSVGVRRDTRAVKLLVKLLQNDDAIVARAAARALGNIGNAAAAKAIDAALDKVPAASKLDFCEGLFRCAEAMAAQGNNKRALAIYDRLSSIKEPHQVHTGAVNGAKRLRGK